MNADDVLIPETVELLVSKFNKVDDMKVVIHGNWDMIDSNGSVLKEYKEIDCSNMSLFKQNVILLDRNIVNNMTTILHKETFTNYGYYDDSIKAAIDYEMWLRLCLQYGFKLHLINKTLVKYRVHNENVTARAIKETPNYVDDLRKLVLNRLDPTERKRYEKGLKRYRKIKKLKMKSHIPVNILKKKIFPKLSKN